jgi:hypothetical protein
MTSFECFRDWPEIDSQFMLGLTWSKLTGFLCGITRKFEKHPLLGTRHTTMTDRLDSIATGTRITVRDEGFIGRSEADSGNARVLGWLKAYMNSEVTKEKVLSNSNAQNGVRNSYRFRTRSLPGSSRAGSWIRLRWCGGFRLVQRILDHFFEAHLRTLCPCARPLRFVKRFPGRQERLIESSLFRLRQRSADHSA